MRRSARPPENPRVERTIVPTRAAPVAVLPISWVMRARVQRPTDHIIYRIQLAFAIRWAKCWFGRSRSKRPNAIARSRSTTHIAIPARGELLGLRLDLDKVTTHQTVCGRPYSTVPVLRINLRSYAPLTDAYHEVHKRAAKAPPTIVSTASPKKACSVCTG